MGKQEFRERLNQIIRDQFGNNKRKFASATKLSEPAIQTYLVRGSIPKGDTLLQIARAAGVTPEWLLGEEDLPVRAIVETVKLTDGDVYRIPLVEGGLSAGTGAVPADNIIGHLVVPKADLKRAEGYECRYVATTVHGDSMEPELHAGDALVIDRVDNDLKRLRRDSIYAVRSDGHVYAKRLRIDSRRKELHLISENIEWTRRHGVEIVSLADKESPVIGRVVLCIRKWE